MEKTAYIDNKPYAIGAGETILEYVRRNLGREMIPTLCQADNLENYGSCRICSVDVALQENGPAKVMASCHTPVMPGYYIYPSTDRIRRLRKNILELVLSEYPAERLMPEAGMLPTEFQSVVATSGSTAVRYPRKISEYEKDRSRPYVWSDFTECIKCYRCVRACDELQTERVLWIHGRADRSRIIKDFDRSFIESTCVSCGACVQTCPTNALSDRYSVKTLAADKTVRTTCTYCGVGCNLDVKVIDGVVRGIQGSPDTVTNRGHTCLKGRYAFEFYNHPDRLRSPIVRKNGILKEVSWDEAYEFTAKRFREIRDKYGPDALAGISSARCTNEENYLMQKFFRIVIGTNNIDGCARVCHAPTAMGMQWAFGAGAATNSIDDMYRTGCMLVIGANPVDAHPVTGARIKSVTESGVPLIVIDPLRIGLARVAKHHLQINPGTNVAVLNLFAYYLLKEGLVDEDFIDSRTDGWEDFKDHLEALDGDEQERICGVDREQVRAAAIDYGSASAAMEFHGLGVTEHWQATKAITLISNIAMMTGNIGRPGTGVNPLRGQNNVQGAADMGIQPHQGAGYLDVTNPENIALYTSYYGVEHPSKPGLRIPEMFAAAATGELKALWIMGEDILQTDPNTCHVRSSLQGLEFLVVQEIFMSETARIADVIFPASSFLEKEGTFTNGERRIQKVRKVVDPLKGTRPDGRIVVEMMNCMGYPQEEYSAACVLKEIAGIVPFFRGVKWEELGKNGKQWPVLEDGTDTRIMHVGTFRRGKGKFHSWDYENSPELIEHSADHPYILTTGRLLEHYNSGTMTRRTPNSEIVTEDLLFVNPHDASVKGLVSGDFARIFSARGITTMKVEVTDVVKPGVIYSTFHFPEAGINFLTSGIGDEYTLTPEYKVAAVDFEKSVYGIFARAECRTDLK